MIGPEDRNPTWMRYFLIKEKLAGAEIPTGYGIAWKCWNKDAYVIMPIPFNILTSWFRSLWYAGIHGYTLDALAKAEQKGYEEGKLAAKQAAENKMQREADRLWNKAFAAGWQACIDKMLAELDKKLEESRRADG